jgi:hypothetical protein
MLIHSRRVRRTRFLPVGRQALCRHASVIEPAESAAIDPNPGRHSHLFRLQSRRQGES